MRGEIGAIRAAGVELVVVGSGKPWHAAAFRDERGIDFPLVVDPSLAAFQEAGLRRGALLTLGPKSLVHAIRAWKGGNRQGRTMGDP